MTASGIAASLALSAMLAGCGWSLGGGTSGISAGDALVVYSAKTRIGVRDVAIGEPLFYGLWTARAKGTTPIHLEKIEVLGAPANFIIDQVWAAKISDFPKGIIGGSRGVQEKTQLLPLLVRVDMVTLDPSCPRSVGCGPLDNPGSPASRDLGWYLIAEAHVTAKGRFVASGITVYYSVDGIHYEQTMPGIEIAAESSGAPMPPQPTSS